MTRTASQPDWLVSETPEPTGHEVPREPPNRVARSDSNRRFPRGRISRRELADVSSQLSIMAKSGVDVATGLQSLVRQSRNPSLKAILGDVHANVVAGMSFSQALDKHSSTFGKSFVASVSAAEAAGQLPEVLAQISRLQRRELKLRNTLRTLMTYPFMLTTISLTVIVVLVLFVIPQFAEIFRQYDRPLPVLTQMLLQAALNIRAYWVILVIVLAAAISASTAFLLSGSGHRFRDNLLLRGVFLRSVSQPLMIGRICRLLGMMLESGVPLVEALQMVRASVRSDAYIRLFDQLEDDVVNGRSMGPALQSASFVPTSAAELLSTAEQTGNLTPVSKLLAEYYEEEGEGRMRELVTILEPVITVVMGMIVAVIVLSIMLPIFDLTTLTT